ncbi:MAG TPA: calcium-binding protein [Thermoleophilaceae bacterium]|nr:calcium-binding protein [Thermoleophilaceae bacterium]
MKKVLLTASLALVLCVAGSSHAMAATLTITSGIAGTGPFYSADSGEVNDLVVTLTATDYVFTDSGAVITPLPPCAGGGPPAGTPATCPRANVDLLQVLLADLDDEAVVEPATRATMIGGLDDDTMTGGGGDDRLEGEEGDDTLDGGAGDDEVNGEELLSTTTGTNELEGGPGDDTLNGGEGEDTASGGSGVDTLFGFGGVDNLDGGEDGDDVSGGDANDVMRGGAGDDRVGSDSLIIRGAPPERGNDALDGGAGDDVLHPGLGPTQGINDDDTLNGGSGNDSVTFEDRTRRVNVFLDAQPNDGGAGERDNVAGDVERLVGGQAGDLLVGGPANDTIDGSLGADTIQGGGGADTLDGGVNDFEGDALSGGEGGDFLRGNAGDDQLQGDQGGDNLDGGTGSDGLQGGADADQVMGGAGVDNLSGGTGDDQLDGAAPVLLGADGGDLLQGDEGNDSLRGGPANDTLEGGDGSDDMRGEAGSDAADYSVADRAVRVSLDSRPNDGVRAERDNVRSDVENVDGGSLQDTFTGSGGPNRLDGGAGEDYIDGRRGADQLVGGGAVDVVRARDGRARDTVSCGRGKDFAIVSRRDRVRPDCEAFDNGLQRVPRVGRAFVVRSVRGANGFGPPGMRRTVPLLDRLRLPMASQVDATKGSVSITAARGGGGQQKGVFSRGRFQVRQRRSAGAFTELRLRGGDFGRCGGTNVRGASRGAVSAQRRRIIRRLRARTRGRYRVPGRHSAGLVRGTSFEVIDRCDGTLTRVFSGVVRVRDFRRRRTVTVRAGKSYLARARFR